MYLRRFPILQTPSFTIAAALALATLTCDLAAAPLKTTQNSPFTPIGSYTGTSSVSGGSRGHSRIALLGDVDGDGVREVAFSTQGRAELVDGASGASIGSWGYPGPVFVAAVNDADGDGVSDLMIGAPYVNVVGGRSGIIETVSGATGTVTRLRSGTFDSYFGMSICRIEDLDGDGRDDVACGANHDTLGGGWGPNGGACYQVSTASGALLSSNAGTGYFGSSLTVGPDLTGDGVEDFVVSRGYNSAAPGYFRVYSGASGTLHWESSSSEIYYGSQHDIIEDVNGDGVRDVAAAGRTTLTICSGVDGAQLLQVPLPEPEPGLGGVAYLRDCSAVLGTPAIALGWPNSSVAGSDSGTVVIFDPTTSSVVYSLHGQTSGVEFGSSLLAREDWNGDGQPDLAVASGNYDVSGTTRMRVDVFSGAPPDCNSNGVADLDDISGGTSFDCNGNSIPDECDIAAGTAADCNGNGIPDSCDIATAIELDCNGNGVPDSCDLLAGTSLDCDDNGVPDECDIASGASDCDADGVPDACQITNDGSLDLNANGVLDSCEAIGTNYCSPAIANSTGAPAEVLALGSEASASNDVTLTVRGLPLNTFTMFFTSQTQGYAFPIPGSQGALCVVGFPGRFDQPGQIRPSGSSGSLSFPLDLTALPTPIGFTSALPGQTWNFQAWYRDANPTPTSNFTDAVSITFQ